MRTIAASLGVNLLLSWMLLPVVLPPFRLYSFRELIEVLLWQGMGAIGWPLALLGGVVSLLVQGVSSVPIAFLLVLIYPAMLLLLVLILFSRRSRGWALALLHVLLTFSFAVVWRQVLNGYDFMIG